MEYSTDQLNYFRVCFLTRNIITNGLRVVFKTEWNTRYKASLGEWQDQEKNGNNFWNQEGTKSRKKNRKSLKIIKNGDTKEWDCTVLFFAILYSDCIGKSLSSTTFNHVDGLREFRNDVFHALPEEKISDSQFQKMIQFVESMFTGLNLLADDIKALASQKDFPTEELRNARDMLLQEKDRAAVLAERCDALEEKCDALEEQLTSTPKSFLASLPPKPSHVVKKREHEVSEVIKKLEELSQTCGDSTVYLSGNPGCGKSQLARQIAENFYEQTSYKEEPFIVATLNGANHEQMAYSYHKFCLDLGCIEYTVSKITGSHDLTPQQKLEQFKCLTAPKLKDFPSWLLIVDNVVDLAEVREYWPTSDCIQHGVVNGGNIIVTTQDYRGIPDCGPKCHDFRLSAGMRPDDAVILLNNITQSADPDNSEEIVEVLDWQPLAIACAGLYLCNVRAHGSPQFGWKDYLEKLNEGKEERMGEVMKEKETSYKHSMFKAVKMAVERAVENEEVLFHSLHFLSVCAPSPIPLEVVVQFVHKRTTDSDDQEIRAKIIDCCLLQFDGCDNTLSFHQVLHRVIKSEKYFDSTSTKAFEMIAAALEPVELMADDESSRKKLFVEHVSAFLLYVTSVHSAHTNFYAELNKVLDVSLFFEFFISFAFACLHYGKMAVVKKCYHLVRTFIEENGCMKDNCAVDDQLSSLLLFFSGYVMAELSDYSSAIDYYNKSLSLRHKIHSEQHEDVARCLNNLATIHYKLNQFNKSLSCFQEALSIYRALHGEKHDTVATCLMNMGGVNRDLHHYKEAESFIQRAMLIYREVCGENSERVARCLVTLGQVNVGLCKFSEAEELYNKALDIFSDIYGSCHPQTARCLRCLGDVNRHLHKYKEAEELCNKALNIFSDIYGSCHLDTAHCLRCLGDVNRHLHKYKEAEELYNKALNIFSDIYGSCHLQTARCLRCLGDVNLHLHKYKEAEELCNKALNIFSDIYGSCHLDTAHCLRCLGDVNLHLHKYKEAEELYNKALNIYSDIYGSCHPQTADCLNNLGSVHFNCCRYNEARDLFEQSLRIYDDVGDQDGVGRCLYNLGLVCEQLLNMEEAVKFFNSALEKRKSIYPVNHPEIQRCAERLDRAQRKLNEQRNAEKHEQQQRNRSDNKDRKKAKDKCIVL